MCKVTNELMGSFEYILFFDAICFNSRIYYLKAFYRNVKYFKGHSGNVNFNNQLNYYLIYESG